MERACPALLPSRVQYYLALCRAGQGIILKKGRRERLNEPRRRDQRGIENAALGSASVRLLPLLSRHHPSLGRAARPEAETKPLVAQPLPRVLEPASSEAAQLPFHRPSPPFHRLAPPAQVGRPPHVGDGLHVGQRNGLRHRACLPLKPCSPGSGVRTAGTSPTQHGLASSSIYPEAHGRTSVYPA